MAGSTVIGALHAYLGIDSAEFVTGARKAQGTLASLHKSFKTFAVTAGSALALGGVTAVLKSAIDRMDEMGKSAQKMGMPVEQLSGLAFAARLADVNLEELQGNVTRFNKSLGEIAGGGCLLYTSPSPRDGLLSRMPSSA